MIIPERQAIHCCHAQRPKSGIQRRRLQQRLCFMVGDDAQTAILRECWGLAWKHYRARSKRYKAKQVTILKGTRQKSLLGI